MKLLFFLLGPSLFAASNQFLQSSVVIGWPSQIVGSNGTSFNLNAAANEWGNSFVPDQAKTLNSVSFYCGAVSGTLGNTDTLVSLNSDSSGAPGSSIESHGGKCTAAALLTVSGFTTALTAGTMYWIVVTNANGTPASNNFTVAYPAITSGPMTIGTEGLYGWQISTSANTGSTWTSVGSTSSIWLGFSDSTYQGLVSSGVSRPGSATTGTDCSYGTQEAGDIFTIPANSKLNVRGLGMQLNKTGTPGTLAFRLYQGTTLLATTYAIPAANVTTGTGGSWYYGYFTSNQTVQSGSYRVTMVDGTSGDSSSNRYCAGNMQIPNDATSLSLVPMDGTLQETVTTNNAGTPPVFSQTVTRIMPFSLLLDTNGEFGSQATTPTTGTPIQ